MSRSGPLPPTAVIDRERFFADWMTKSDKKCSESWFKIRSEKIIDFLALGLEGRRDKLRAILDKEAEDYVNACKEKLRLVEVSRKEAVIEEAKRLKAFIEKRNNDFAERARERRMRNSCADYRDNKAKQLVKTMSEDRKMIDQFNEFKRAYEKEREDKLNSLKWDFITDLNGKEDVRLKLKHEKEMENFEALKGQLAEHVAQREREAEAKKAEGRMVDEEIAAVKALKLEQEKKRLDAQVETRRILSSAVQEHLERRQKRKEWDESFNQASANSWKEVEEGESVSRVQRMHRQNREARYFLEHQKQLREYRKCEEEIRDKLIAEDAEKERQLKRMREAERRAFLKKLEEETYADHRSAMARKAQRLKEIKEMDEAEFNKMLDAMKVQELKREEEMKAKEKEHMAIREAQICQLEDRRKRREEEVQKLQRERAGYAQAEKEYLERLNKVANPVPVSDFNIHPWRKKAMNLPMDR
ncbi:unnamed protein product [Schistocephalus solidus]|uniref:Cilia- and flagella-associated protein 53 n=1 Tax=Schistocephalus solidus TaxID=70667 RepID=A0A183T8M3_SCHSO|nr:unnamed protein product [Schistocephalus solidus]